MRFALIIPILLLTSCNDDHLRSLVHTSIKFAYHNCQRLNMTESECHIAIDKSMDQPLEE